MSDHRSIIGAAAKTANGVRAYAAGLHGEDRACAVLENEGFTILGRRLRTACGEIDIAAATGALLVFAEVKCRRDLASAAAAVTARQRMRLIGAAEILLAENAAWARPAIRFDVIIIDRAGRMRRIADAFRLEA